MDKLICRLCSYLPDWIGDRLYLLLCHPRHYFFQRRLDREKRARFKAFCDARGIRKVKGKLVKDYDAH